MCVHRAHKYVYVKYNGNVVATVNCERLKYGSNAFDLYDILHARINVARVVAVTAAASAAKALQF